jgi:hypothetical protein
LNEVPCIFQVLFGRRTSDLCHLFPEVDSVAPQQRSVD